MAHLRCVTFRLRSGSGRVFCGGSSTSLTASPGIPTMPAVPDPFLAVRISPRLPFGTSVTAPYGSRHRISASCPANQAIGVARTNLAAHPSQSQRVSRCEPCLAARLLTPVSHRRKRRRLTATITTRRIATGAVRAMLFTESRPCGQLPVSTQRFGFSPRSLRSGFCPGPGRRFAAAPCGNRCANSHSRGPQVVSQRAQPYGRPTSHGNLSTRPVPCGSGSASSLL